MSEDTKHQRYIIKKLCVTWLSSDAESGRLQQKTHWYNNVPVPVVPIWNTKYEFLTFFQETCPKIGVTDKFVLEVGSGYRADCTNLILDGHEWGLITHSSEMHPEFPNSFAGKTTWYLTQAENSTVYMQAILKKQNILREQTLATNLHLETLNRTMSKLALEISFNSKLLIEMIRHREESFVMIPPEFESS